MNIQIIPESTLPQSGGNPKKLRIFIASPSDVAAERAKVETAAAALKPLADFRSSNFLMELFVKLPLHL